jgi:hypothetical protein
MKDNKDRFVAFQKVADNKRAILSKALDKMGNEYNSNNTRKSLYSTKNEWNVGSLFPYIQVLRFCLVVHAHVHFSFRLFCF